MKKFSLNDKKHETPFVSPENYFENLGERVQKRIQGEQEPVKISRKLPFGVPENYFELLPQRIMKRISSLKPKVWYKERTTWQWAMAACSLVLLVWVGNSWFAEKSNSKQVEISEKLKNIDKEELENYIAFNPHREVIFDEIKDADIISEKFIEEIQKHTETKIQDLPKEDLEDQLPEHLLQEMLEEEFDEAGIEDILQEKDSI
jgi:hypothetical protein